MPLYVGDHCGFYFSLGAMGRRARDSVLCVRTSWGMCGRGAGIKGRGLENERRENPLKLAPTLSNRLFGPVILEGGLHSL